MVRIWLLLEKEGILKLFISLLRTVEEVESGAVTQEDLLTGLFYFSCSRNVVLQPHWASQWEKEAKIEARSGQRHAAAHSMIVAAVLLAEADGRVAWYEPGKPMRFESVNEMLRRAGFSEIAGYDGRPRDWACNGQGIEARLKEKNIPIDVIY